MKGESSNHDWKRVQSLGLCSTVENRDIYHQLAAENWGKVYSMVWHYPDANPSPAYILEAHKRLFNTIHPWAGQFREFLENSGVGGFFGAETPRIERELDLLNCQFSELVSGQGLEGRVLAIAFWHVRFERIHPFLDGNGRVGRLLMLAQLNALCGLQKRTSLVVDKARYIDALRISHKSKDLGPLMGLIAGMQGLSLNVPESISIFRLAPFMEQEKRKSLAEELEDSRL